MKKILLFSIVVTVLFACGPVQQNGLPNTGWIVSNLNTEIGEGIQFADKPVPSLIFNKINDSIFGETGCNSFFGTYKVDGDKLSINVVGQSMALCPDADTEARYMDALKNCTTYKIEQDALILFNAAGQPLVSFIPMVYPAQ